MADQHDNRAQRAVELLFLAPIGLFGMVRDVAPTVVAMLVNRGRNEVEHRQQQLRTAKSTGEVALAFGVPMLREKIETRLGRAPAAGDGSPATDDTDDTVDTDEAAEESAVVDLTVVPGVDREEPRETGPEESGPDLELVGAAPDAGPDAAADPGPDLAIPGYDTLSASQVVERLAGLGPDDLDAIRAHELAHRKRRTILGKIEQLDRAAGAGPTSA